MKLNTLIIDDEPLAHDILLKYSADVPFLEVVGHCYLATEAIPWLSTHKIDLLFLDIRMPKLQGLDFLRTLRLVPLVIITSAYEAHALESFELDVCDYLLKPFRFERFLKAVHKALELYQLKNQAPKSTPVLHDSLPVAQPFFIKSDKRRIQLEPKDIYYVEAYGNYVKIWMENQFHLSARTLSSMTEQLPECDFIRIHKSFLVNKHHVAYLEGNTVVLKNKKALQLGKNYKHIFDRIISAGK